MGGGKEDNFSSPLSETVKSCTAFDKNCTDTLQRIYFLLHPSEFLQRTWGVLEKLDTSYWSWWHHMTSSFLLNVEVIYYTIYWNMEIKNSSHKAQSIFKHIGNTDKFFSPRNKSISFLCFVTQWDLKWRGLELNICISPARLHFHLRSKSWIH